MFCKKRFFAVLAATVFFSLLNFQIFAASRNITSLKLNFLRTEAAVESEASSMTGTVVYNKNPFVFIFQIKTPVVQTMYVNDKGAYLFEGDSVYEINQNRDFLEQTCRDFLNWFKEDYGLEDSFFKPADRWLEEGAVISEWDCYKPEDQPINKVLVYSDGNGRFTRLQMYTDNNALVTDTTLDSFKSAQGYSYPTSINSVSYDGGQIFLQTKLEFSDIKFVLTSQEMAELNSLVEQNDLFLKDLPKADLSDAYTITTPLTPSTGTYRVGLTSVLVGASFNFYKKFITSQDMSNCPFYPSCSQFMLEAVSSNGVFGFFQGLERLRRCTSAEHKRDQYETLSNGKHYDPVPVMEKSK